MQATENIVVQQNFTLLSGNFRVYVGYGIDGVIYYNAQPHQFSVTTKEKPDTITPPIPTPTPVVTVPDLAITSSGVLPSTALVGDSVQLRVMVNNIGNALAAGSQINYHLRATPDANPGDALLCSEKLPNLQPGQNSPESCSITVPSTAGEYYYGICVKPVIGENNLTNNCSSALKLNVVKPIAVPDLAITSSEFSSSTVPAGNLVQLHVTVNNIGDALAVDSRLSYYLRASTDANPYAELQAGDDLLCSQRLSNLQPGQKAFKSCSVTVPSTMGEYYYGICVKTVLDENNLTNNCSSALKVKVGNPFGVPDLAITSSEVSPSTVSVGDSVRLRVMVNNIGEALAEGIQEDIQISYYLRASTDANPYAELQAGDDLLCSEELSNLQPGQNASGYCSVTVPSTVGEYYYGICVKTVIDENSLVNNCSSALKLNVVNPVVPVTPALSPTGKLNDTGITDCLRNSSLIQSCPLNSYPEQDAQSGRDVTDNDNSNGHKGFSFTKISETGEGLDASETAWNCVQDNVTNLMWEVKTDDGGLHDKNKTYFWYEPNIRKNGGFAGFRCSQCDTHTYVQAVNDAGWCGHNDWRMPTINELSGITSLDRKAPAIDTDYFPNTRPSSYWSSSTNAYKSYRAWTVHFYDGGSRGSIDADRSKSSNHYGQVRLVRSEQ